MLMYNHKKEFIGIDEHNLRILGFSTLSQLINETKDFADLFVKTPGYIHNFQHIHWIDFVLCAESNQESKVIMSVKGKNFRCYLDIVGIYLKEDPINMGYVINLVNLRALSQAEYEIAKKGIDQKTATKPYTPPVNIIEDDYKQVEYEKENKEIKHSEFEANDTISTDDFDTFEDPIKDVHKEEPLETQYENIEVPKEIKQEAIVPLYNQSLEVQSDYVYDPHVACDALGLPLELIEEFIQDFVAQAEDFKVELHDSLHDRNIDNLKILSHKLKGVAANLRIEDAFEVLSIINHSEDFLELEQSLNTFYRAVDKLTNKEEMPTQEDSQNTSDEVKEDIVLQVEDIESDIYEMMDVPASVVDDDDFIKIKLDEDIFEKPQEEIKIQMNTEIHYDRAKAASEIGIDIQNFNELFVDFIEEAKVYMSQIRKAITKSDFEASKNSCIKLKRMCETMIIDSFDEELNFIMKVESLSTAEQALASIDTKLHLISKNGEL